jgi:transposase-like protein
MAHRHCAAVDAKGGYGSGASSEIMTATVTVTSPEIRVQNVFHRYLKPVNKSYRIDETYIKVKGEDKYLYRALDSTTMSVPKEWWIVSCGCPH